MGANHVARIAGNPTVVASRRRALTRVASGVVALLGHVPRSTVAQDDCPESPVSLQPPALLLEWADAWNAADPATAVATLYTDNALYEDIPRGTDTTLLGTDVAGFLAPFVAATSELVFGLRAGYQVGERATAEWELAFRYTGRLPGLPPGAGQEVAYRGVTTFQLAGEQIRRSTSYYDFAALLAATGVLPAPAAAATPTA